MSPLKLSVGGVLTVYGKNFVAGKNRNYVIFQRARAPAVFVKADNATTTKITPSGISTRPVKNLRMNLSRRGGDRIS